jgi:hypothetical protein
MPTPLLPIAPVGTGTADVESLASYAMRLTTGHRVNRGALFCSNARQSAAPRGPAEFPAISNRDGSITTSPLGRRIADRLAAATGTSDVRQLNWWHEDNGVSLVRICSPHARWCPVCFRRRCYLPAKWELSLGTACAEHRCRLVDRCPKCDHTVPFFRASMGNCPHCQWGLGDAEALPASEAEGRLARELETWVTLVTNRPAVLQMNPVPALLAWAAARGRSSVHQQARLFGTSLSTISGWRAGRPVALARVMEICARMEIQLAAVMTGVVVRASPPPAVPARWLRRSELAPSDTERIRQRLEIWQSLGLAPGLRRAARQLGVDRHTLRRLAPRTCTGMVVTRAELRRRIAAMRWLCFTAQVGIFIRHLRGTGRPLTMRNVYACFAQPGFCRHPRRRLYIREAVARERAAYQGLIEGSCR